MGRLRTNPRLLAALVLTGTLMLPALAPFQVMAATSECDVPVADLLNTIDARVEQHQLWSTSFTQSNHIKVLSTPLLSSGEVFIDATRGVVWQVQQPIESTLVIDQTGVDFGQGTMASTRVVAELLRALLSGNLLQLSDSFEVSGCAHEDGWQLRLLHGQAALAARISELHLSGGQWLTQLQIRQSNGNDIAIEFAPPEVHSTAPDIIAKHLDATGT